jgi:hypothetical protein
MNAGEARKILGVDGPASPERLKAAFRRAARKFHPDRFQTFTEKAWATKRFIRARKAYELLRAAPGRSTPAAGAVPPRPPPPPGPAVPSPEEVGIRIDIDPFRGYRTLANLLLFPLRLAVGEKPAGKAPGELSQAALGLFVVAFFPAGFGLAAILLPVTIVHFFLLGAGAAIDHALGGTKRRIADRIAGSHVFFAVEIGVGGTILAMVLTRWFGTPDLTVTEAIIGALLWGAPVAFLLMEIAGFTRSLLAARTS